MLFAHGDGKKDPQMIADEAARQYNTRCNPTQTAAGKGYGGLRTTRNNGVSFQGSGYMHKSGDKETVKKISATGKRGSDFSAANGAFNFGGTPEGYVWHHLDDYNVAQNTCTMELVLIKAHNASKPHAGACSQYDAVYGPSYNPPKKG
uniref:HNH endonuclease n=1 Tax=Agathobacter sp. TaxID=2021311 RepID=UPI004056DB31